MKRVETDNNKKGTREWQTPQIERTIAERKTFSNKFETMMHAQLQLKNNNNSKIASNKEQLLVGCG